MENKLNIIQQYIDNIYKIKINKLKISTVENIKILQKLIEDFNLDIKKLCNFDTEDLQKIFDLAKINTYILKEIINIYDLKNINIDNITDNFNTLVKYSDINKYHNLTIYKIKKVIKTIKILEDKMNVEEIKLILEKSINTPIKFNDNILASMNKKEIINYFNSSLNIYQTDCEIETITKLLEVEKIHPILSELLQPFNISELDNITINNIITNMDNIIKHFEYNNKSFNILINNKYLLKKYKYEMRIVNLLSQYAKDNNIYTNVYDLVNQDGKKLNNEIVQIFNILYYYNNKHIDTILHYIQGENIYIPQKNIDILEYTDVKKIDLAQFKKWIDYNASHIALTNINKIVNKIKRKLTLKEVYNLSNINNNMSSIYILLDKTTLENALKIDKYIWIHNDKIDNIIVNNNTLPIEKISDIKHKVPLTNLYHSDSTIFNYIINKTNKIFLIENKSNLDINLSEEANILKILNTEPKYIQAKEIGLPKEFILSNNFKYYNETMNNAHLSKIDKKNFIAITKAYTENNYKDFKYKTLDLELDTIISPNIKRMWVENKSISKDNYTIFDTDDYILTLRIGELPTQTCMNYNNGIYSQALLSNFDANKKIVYIKNNKDIIVGRAIIKLIKYKNNINLSFDEDTNVTQSNNIGILVEKLYTSDENVAKLKILLQDFITEKIADTNVKGLYSNSYYSFDNIQTEKKQIFITYSRNSVAYSDSMRGQIKKSQEGSYDTIEVYIK